MSTEAIIPNGKAPAQEHEVTSSHRHGPVSVQPARLADLQPRYAQQIQHDADNPEAHGWYASMIHGLGECIGFFGAIPCCICCPNPFKPVDQGEVGLVSKFGRFERAVDPGLVKVNPLSEHLTTIDVKIQIVEVPRQVCMTKDNVTLNLTSVIYYQIISPHKAAFGISNVRQALVERTQTTLRHVIGARVLQDVIERREEIAQSTAEIIEEVASGWGVQVESMLIKDIIFSNDLQDSLSMAAQSKRIGESKVIAARAEVESAKLMRQAADILSSAPAMQIRYLEAMQAMAKTANSKVIFLPAMNQTVQQQLAAADNAGEGPSRYSGATQADDGFQRAMNARVVEDI
ncbi:slipin family protein [Aspergillus clavatus NRRL 1]|uniref:Stomatin family protein n=1 Tax=Aspergillus clavatus (strain ATCC 1007 / CBS 513.65 / DSM 816 / NCTC 3887 / NRRL 1 / QM 1276 / 107) TaxID=344612 RepID=A1CL74_ASPCL|nr:stomatin family protein [Aspergillus clavatus NRRL 1]EAW09898.1 stomatin family protein [Aspergillus clavatus NRRL 1]